MLKDFSMIANDIVPGITCRCHQTETWKALLVSSQRMGLRRCNLSIVRELEKARLSPYPSTSIYYSLRSYAALFTFDIFSQQAETALKYLLPTMLKDLFDKGKCALGFHAGDWRYLREGQCQQVRVCPRCKTESQQLVHAWQSWQHPAAGSCQLARRCGRCGDQETKIEHVWGTPVYQADGSCVVIRPCSRCGETTSAGTTHVWESWAYDVADNCSQTVSCSRCGETGTGKRVAHNWGSWQDSSFYRTRVRVCRHCAEMVFDPGNVEEKDPVSLQIADRAVRNVMESEDVATVRERITKHSDVLFSPVTEKYFSFAIDQRAPDEDTKDTFRKLAGLIDRCRTEGIDAVFNTPTEPSSSASVSPSQDSTAISRRSGSTPATEELDQRLLGHWRHIEPISGFTTDTNCLLDPSGRFQWWSVSVSTFGTTRSGPEDGNWSTSGSTLHLRFDDGTHLAFDYVIENGNLFCPNEGRYRLWHRVN